MVFLLLLLLVLLGITGAEEVEFEVEVEGPMRFGLDWGWMLRAINSSSPITALSTSFQDISVIWLRLLINPTDSCYPNEKSKEGIESVSIEQAFLIWVDIILGWMDR